MSKRLGAVTSQTVFTIFPVVFFGLVLVITQTTILDAFQETTLQSHEDWVQNNIANEMYNLCISDEDRVSPADSNHTRDFGSLVGFRFEVETWSQPQGAFTEVSNEIHTYDDEEEISFTSLIEEERSPSMDPVNDLECEDISFNGSTTNIYGEDGPAFYEGGETAFRIFDEGEEGSVTLQTLEVED